jgi:hydroxymethylglutaryl-CoA reductase
MAKPSEVKTRKFHQLTLSERLNQLAVESGLPVEELKPLTGAGGLNPEQADHMVENALGVFSLPIGIARNFVVNGRPVLVPMVIEEPSVIAAASFMARLAANNGGFRASTTASEMIGQIQILDVPDLAEGQSRLLAHKDELLAAASTIDPLLSRFGGGPRGIEVRRMYTSPIGPFLVLHLIYDVRDAMGANAINTALEKLAPRVAEISGGRTHLRILSNLADRRLARASVTIRLQDLAFENYSAETVRDGIIAAWAFAAVDPYRAATHNKGIMNGVDAVVLATGNDWRAVEAGAHAYAARTGTYTSLSSWSKDAEGNLTGSLEMPMAVGIVGGATRVHPGAQAALKLMKVESARQLAEIIVSVGLAQNLGALRALATEGIQRGHMSLHARQVAISAGAVGDEIDRVAEQLAREGVIRTDLAEQILKEWRNKPS